MSLNWRDRDGGPGRPKWLEFQGIIQLIGCVENVIKQLLQIKLPMFKKLENAAKGTRMPPERDMWVGAETVLTWLSGTLQDECRQLSQLTASAIRRGCAEHWGSCMTCAVAHSWSRNKKAFWKKKKKHFGTRKKSLFYIQCLSNAICWKA